MPRIVVLEPFGEIMRLGLRCVLDGAECRVLDEHCGDAIDAVLFDMDQRGCDAVALALKAAHPGACVIACSTRVPVMRVFQPGHTDGPRPLTAAALCAAVTMRAAAAPRA